MIKKYLALLIFGLILILPAYAGITPGTDPAPGKEKTTSPKTTSPQKTTGQVIVIRTAKDPKANQTKVGEKGEILIPQSTAIAGAALAGAAAGGVAGGGLGTLSTAGAGALKGTEADDEAKSSGISGDSNKSDDSGGFKGASGSSGGGDSKSSGLASGAAGSTGNDNGLLGGGVPSGFSSLPDNSILLPDNTTAATSITTFFTLTATAGTNGAISPAGAMLVISGDSQSFTITPNTSFHVADVLVDGTSVGPVTSFSFTSIAADHTIAASFAALPTAQLQALLDVSVSDGGIPGVVMAIQTPTETWISAAGKADLGDTTLGRDPQDMTADTQVRLAGVTRLFTAALIMKLVEENKIKLDDKVDDLLGPGAVPSGDQITVAMLLNHTSGLHDHETTQELFSGLISLPSIPWHAFNDILIPIIESYPQDFDPGAKFQFSSTDYFLLGLLADPTYPDLPDDTVADMIKTDFFDPLNLAHTTLTRAGSFNQTEPFARSYYYAGITPDPAWGWLMVPEFPTLADTTKWDLSFDWTNGSGVSTAQDILTFTTALFAGKVVNPQSLQQMITPQRLTSAQGALPYGFGLEVVNSDPWFAAKVYKNDGETTGAYARWLYYPDSGRTIFIAFNRGDKRFNTDPAPAPVPGAPQVDASKMADSILNVASTLIKTAR